MLKRIDSRNGLSCILLASALITAIPACTAAAGPGAPSAQIVAEPPSSRIVYRPPYPIPGTRPLYIKGYAGLSYAPGGRQATPAEATGYYERPARPFGWWLNRRAWTR